MCGADGAARADADAAQIQELNYKITILINSDLKSEIERLRWITTRRGLIAIATLASMSGGLRPRDCTLTASSIRGCVNTNQQQRKEGARTA